MIKNIILLITLLFWGFGAMAQTPPIFQREQFTIQTKAGAKHVFELELALTNAQQSTGLMHRKAMPEKNGMIFFWGEMKQATMWMKNTYLPLDMVFFDQKGIITEILYGAEPLSEKTLSTKEKSFGVIEFNAGIPKKLHIKPGDKILSPRF